MIPLGVVALLVVIGVIGAAAGSSPHHNDAKVTPLVSTSASPTLTSHAPSTTPTRTSTAPRSTATTPSQAPTTSRPVVAPSPTDDGSFVMPSEVGKGLQAAQDDVQQVSGDPVFVSHSHDLLSSRFQVLDRDWKVCSQNVVPGTKASAIEHIDFGVVKLDENCP